MVGIDQTGHYQYQGAIQQLLLLFACLLLSQVKQYTRERDW